MTQDILEKRKKKRILLKIGIGILSLIILINIAIGIILNTIVTPQKITPFILGVAHEYIDAQVNCESIDITFFSTFPNLGVKLQQGSVIHHSQTTASTDSTLQTYALPQDTLITFQHCIVSLNPIAFLIKKQIIINQLEIKDADIYAFVDVEGKKNWDIFTATTEEEKKEENKKTSQAPELNINNIRLQNINLVYDDLQQDLFLMVDSLRMRLNGNLSKAKADLDLRLRTSGFSCYHQEKTYAKSIPFSIQTQLHRDRKVKNLSIEKGSVSVGILKLNMKGMLTRGEEPLTTDVDIDFDLNASSLNDLIRMIPEHISDIPSKLKGNGKILSSGKIIGKLGKEQYPPVSVSFKLADGSLRSVKHPDKPLLEKIDIDFYTLLDFSDKEKSSLTLNNLYLQSSSSQITLKGAFNHLLTNPVIDAHAKANINLTQLSKDLPFTKNKFNMGGTINFNLSGNCTLEDIQSTNLGKININGNTHIKNVTFNSVEEDLSFYASLANMAFGSNTSDSIRGRLQESLLRGNITLDSLNLNWKKELMANAGKLTTRFSTSEPQDTGSIAPVMVYAKAENLRLTMGDSIRMRAFKTSAAIRMSSNKENPRLPEVSTRLSLDSLRGRFLTMGGRMSNAVLTLKAVKAAPRQPRTNIAGRDTTLTRVQRDSIRKSRTDVETNLSFRLESKETRDLLRKWEVSGSLISKDISFRTPLFPLPLRMSESEMSFTTNTLSLAKAQVKIGASDLSLNGEIEGIRGALLYNGKVAARLNLLADSIDFNQLIKAAIAGGEYTRKNTQEKDSISEKVLDDNNLVTTELDTIQSGIFVIPRNLNIEFNSIIKHAKYSDLNLQNIRGNIILRDQAIQLPRLHLNSNVGSVNLNMVYKAPNRKGAHLGLDLNMDKVDVKELIKTFPMMDDLTPMLRSFEGVVNCKMTAVTELDSLMNVQLPQTTASCVLNGKNMILLDGETFSEISKTLMFKNKHKNIIDSLSVEMILEEEKLMIFPFQISIDRYEVAVGGIQNLDLSFDYHITVLKSPVPFKLGLNITGSPDKMKIRLAKPKYKNLFTTTREETLNNTTINLRQEMENKLQRSIQEIIGADALRPVRRPTIALPDSLRQTFFLLDTTSVSQEAVEPDSIISMKTP
ncbi:AsmA-like C-terminal region-containing protein [Bacteroides sp. 224]|uniref:AsmA-like C-terminal region-containing protein n=1 Tax=Bacteroides sp. 224 TaxID=2302936 RepID=UPI0013D27D19|nr:AsmA-like C-terminal region-containing protein [Bacteroides sp. 224]NDV66741.1 hypothetical protein [Bacteroides sp. 224]